MTARILQAGKDFVSPGIKVRLSDLHAHIKDDHSNHPNCRWWQFKRRRSVEITTVHSTLRVDNGIVTGDALNQNNVGSVSNNSDRSTCI